MEKQEDNGTVCEVRFQRRCPKCKRLGTLKEERRFVRRGMLAYTGYYALCLACHERLKYFEVYDSVNKSVIASVPYNEELAVRWEEGFSVLERKAAT